MLYIQYVIHKYENVFSQFLFVALKNNNFFSKINISANIATNIFCQETPNIICTLAFKTQILHCAHADYHLVLYTNFEDHVKPMYIYVFNIFNTIIKYKKYFFIRYISHTIQIFNQFKKRLKMFYINRSRKNLKV